MAKHYDVGEEKFSASYEPNLGLCRPTTGEKEEEEEDVKSELIDTRTTTCYDPTQPGGDEETIPTKEELEESTVKTIIIKTEDIEDQLNQFLFTD
ncbi:hypothetical protein AALO_G00091190, partial [Alosa alosa]